MTGGVGNTVVPDIGTFPGIVLERKGFGAGSFDAAKSERNCEEARFVLKIQKYSSSRTAIYSKFKLKITDGKVGRISFGRDGCSGSPPCSACCQNG